MSAVALIGLAIRTDQELLKVPGDVVPTDGTPNDALRIIHESHGIVAGDLKLVLQKDK